GARAVGPPGAGRGAGGRPAVSASRAPFGGGPAEPHVVAFRMSVGGNLAPRTARVTEFVGAYVHPVDCGPAGGIASPWRGSLEIGVPFRRVLAAGGFGPGRRPRRAPGGRRGV